MFTKDELIEELKKIKKLGFVLNSRPSNQGGVGNTLEDLLGIEENNIPLADAGRYEIKTKRKNDKSLSTLFHVDPYPRNNPSILYEILIPFFGWPNRNNPREKSFRATLSTIRYTDRGLKVQIDSRKELIKIIFNKDEVDKARHQKWLVEIPEEQKNDFNPNPYWTFELLKEHVAKIENIIYVFAERKGDYRTLNEEFYYNESYLLEGMTFNIFMKALNEGKIVIDFDARTGYGRPPHNHGTKFRFSDFEELKHLYPTHERIL